MLTQIEIENYRSLRKVELEMRPLTVLIGANGSGKSNLLDAFSLLAAAARGQLADSIARREGFDAVFFRGTQERDKGMRFGLTCATEGVSAAQGRPVTYEVRLRPLGAGIQVWSENMVSYTHPRRKNEYSWPR